VTGPADDQKVIAALAPVIAAIGAEMVDLDAAGDGDIRIDWRGSAVAAVRLPDLHQSLERLLGVVETEIGVPIGSWTREHQQVAIRRLDDLGAFTLRGAVENISKAIGISRITVYNYLNALYR
jgi:hypothetical protein